MSDELLKQILSEIKEIKSTMATKDDIQSLTQMMESHRVQDITADEKLLEMITSARSDIKSIHNRLDHQIGRIAKTEESLDILQKKIPQ